MPTAVSLAEMSLDGSAAYQPDGSVQLVRAQVPDGKGRVILPKPLAANAAFTANLWLNFDDNPEGLVVQFTEAPIETNRSLVGDAAGALAAFYGSLAGFRAISVVDDYWLPDNPFNALEILSERQLQSRAGPLESGILSSYTDRDGQYLKSGQPYNLLIEYQVGKLQVFVNGVMLLEQEINLQAEIGSYVHIAISSATGGPNGATGGVRLLSAEISQEASEPTHPDDAPSPEPAQTNTMERATTPTLLPTPATGSSQTPPTTQEVPSQESNTQEAAPSDNESSESDTGSTNEIGESTSPGQSSFSTQNTADSASTSIFLLQPLQNVLPTATNSDSRVEIQPQAVGPEPDESRREIAHNAFTCSSVANLSGLENGQSCALIGNRKKSTDAGGDGRDGDDAVDDLSLPGNSTSEEHQSEDARSIHYQQLTANASGDFYLEFLSSIVAGLPGADSPAKEAQQEQFIDSSMNGAYLSVGATTAYEVDILMSVNTSSTFKEGAGGLFTSVIIDSPLPRVLRLIALTGGPQIPVWSEFPTRSPFKIAEHAPRQKSAKTKKGRRRFIMPWDEMFEQGLPGQLWRFAESCKPLADGIAGLLASLNDEKPFQTNLGNGPTNREDHSSMRVSVEKPMRWFFEQAVDIVFAERVRLTELLKTSAVV
ncbi:MAG TPA: hypothetical protein VGI40_26535 [Pirellulaceae bacterium]